MDRHSRQLGHSFRQGGRREGGRRDGDQLGRHVGGHVGRLVGGLVDQLVGDGCQSLKQPRIEPDVEAYPSCGA